MTKIFNFIKGHKVIFLILLIVLAGGGYITYKKVTQKEGKINYVTSAVEKGIIISAISGTGQVSASSQVEVKPKTSGDVVFVGAKRGQEVKEGDLIVQIDSRDAVNQISEAKASLEAAELDLEELLAPVDEYTLLQAKNDLTEAEESLDKLKLDQENEYKDAKRTLEEAENNFEKSHEEAFNDISDVFLDFPDVVTGLFTILFSNEISNSGVAVGGSTNKYVLKNSIDVSDYEEKDEFENYVDNAGNNYHLAKAEYDDIFNSYSAIGRYSENEDIKTVLDNTLETLRIVSDAIKSESNLLDYWVDYRTKNNASVYSTVSSYQTDLSSYTSIINNHISSLLSAQNTIEGYEDDQLDAIESLENMKKNNPLEIIQAERNIKELEYKFSDLKAGATELEIKNKQIFVQQKRNSLVSAQETYADCFVRAPFDGQIAELNLDKGDSASNGSTAAIIITNKKIAEITLNEIDAAQVQAGQKATLTFDAVSDLSITGEVAELDIIGEVSSGVVSYGVKVAFDVQDERVKSGMSVGVNIIIESKPNVLLAPLGTVKTMGQSSYVEILVDEQPQRKTVVTGSSNDAMVEIVEGLEEGEEIITQTISSQTSETISASNQDRQTGSGQFGGEFRMFR